MIIIMSVMIVIAIDIDSIRKKKNLKIEGLRKLGEVRSG